MVSNMASYIEIGINDITLLVISSKRSFLLLVVNTLEAGS